MAALTLRAESGMKLDLDHGTGHFIRGYTPGELRVGTETLTADAIVTADRILRDWSPPEVAALGSADAAVLIELDVEVVLLGTGSQQIFPPAALGHALMSRGIGLEVMSTVAACRTFNVLVSESRRVAAALYLR